MTYHDVESVPLMQPAAAGVQETERTTLSSAKKSIIAIVFVVVSYELNFFNVNVVS